MQQPWMCANGVFSRHCAYSNINIKLCITTVTVGIIVGKWMLSFNNDYKTIIYDLKTYFYDS